MIHVLCPKLCGLLLRSNSCFLRLFSLSRAPTALELAVVQYGRRARKRCPIPIVLLVFSMSVVIVHSVFSCTVSVPGGGAVVRL